MFLEGNPPTGAWASSSNGFESNVVILDGEVDGGGVQFNNQHGPVLSLSCSEENYELD